jgi:hypothetical protein
VGAQGLGEVHGEIFGDGGIAWRGDGRGKAVTARRDFALSGVEAEILQSLKQISWANQLWFPVVQRRVLGLQSDAADEEIHDAVVDLIKKQALVPISPHIPFEWEVANLQERPGTDPSLRKISTSAESEARLQRAVESHHWIDELHSTVPNGLASPGDVTYLESLILLKIDHEAWFAYLWFPFVERELLDFGSHAPDDEIQRAILNLMRKGSLVPEHDEPCDMPKWLPCGEAFKTAVYKALGRNI